MRDIKYNGFFSNYLPIHEQNQV